MTVLRFLALGAAVGALVALTTVPASAHAMLQSATPADGAVLDAPPSEVTLDFNEPVVAALGAVRVYNSDEARVDRGEVRGGEDGTVLRVPLARDAGEGTHVVTWRVASGDGHPVNGAFVFSVGSEGTADGTFIAQLLAGGDDTGLQAAAAALRWLLYAAVLLAGGGLAFLVLVHDRRKDERARLVRVVTVASVVGAVTTLLGVGVQGALVTGLGAGSFLNPQVFGEVAGSTYGASAAVRLAGLALLVVAAAGLWRPWATITGLVGAFLALGSFVLTGHTATTEPRWVAVGANLAHTLAAGAWFGGLILLLLALRRRKLSDDAVGGGRLVARFSAMATLAVVAVSVAGGALAWTQVRAVRALTSSAYGWTLLVKVALVGAILAVAGYNRSRLVPAIAGSGRGVTGGPDAPSAAWGTLRSTVRTEIVAIGAVLLVTAVLVNLVPARTAAGVTGIFSTTVPMGEDMLNVTVDPNRAGVNEFHLYLLSPTGQPVDVAGDLTVQLSQPALGIAPIEREPSVAGPGHWTFAGPELAIPGRWTVEVSAPVDRFSDAAASFGLDVNP
ncbi:MAG: copper resistance protein CopC/CopD [Euzebyaceae bacterium]|nr:copper resistance protein CopC/CopD [Euzebyaceae bacterium]